MKVTDLVAVSAIEREAFSTPWSRQAFRSLMGRADSELWVVEAPLGQIAGYAVVWCIGDYGELANLAVRADVRGKGVGAALLDHVLDRARQRGVHEMFLEVRASNRGAVALYESRGFRQVAVRKRYYRAPEEDARVFRRSLD